MNAHRVYIVAVEGRDHLVGFAWQSDADEFARACEAPAASVEPVAVHSREQAAELLEEVSS